MSQWTPGEDSQDRMDALVWLLTALFFEEEEEETTTIGVDMHREISPV